MTMQRHMAEYGTRPEQFGEIAVAVRNHGANNPHAALRVPLTLDKYMESPFIIEPLKRDDICLVSDGAAAVVVMSEKRARELGVKAPVQHPRLRAGADLVRRAAASGADRDDGEGLRRRPRSRWPGSRRRTSTSRRSTTATPSR